MVGEVVLMGRREREKLWNERRTERGSRGKERRQGKKEGVVE